MSHSSIRYSSEKPEASNFAKTGLLATKRIKGLRPWFGFLSLEGPIKNEN
jgi:hypothetical protein